MRVPTAVGTLDRSAPRGGEVRAPSPRPGVRSCGHADTGSSRITTLAGRARGLYDALARRADLEPGPGVDGVFGALVSLAITPTTPGDAASVLADPLIAPVLGHLRALCADGEFALERAWARRVVDHPDPTAALAGFPYHRNYVDLTRLEHHTVTGVAPAPRRVLFVGSGPLPLTSLLLAGEYGCRVDNVDTSGEAARLGADLARAVGAGGLTFHTGDVVGDQGPVPDVDLQDYDLVYVAALAGLDRDVKTGLLDHLARRLRPGAVVLARSAHSLRALLYPVLDPDELPGLDPLAVVHPYTDVVNSVVVGRVRAG